MTEGLKPPFEEEFPDPAEGQVSDINKRRYDTGQISAAEAGYGARTEFQEQNGQLSFMPPNRGKRRIDFPLNPALSASEKESADRVRVPEDDLPNLTGLANSSETRKPYKPPVKPEPTVEDAYIRLSAIDGIPLPAYLKERE